ncbi:extracellular polysaccharide biosynthesis protein [Salmonella enterica subsp. enterica serovar Havana]|nr:extracellular polysaccharide biosynthesis protein [Salmonella enterica subsp. enterica serovar Havana]
MVKKLVRELADTTCSVILIPDVFTFNILHFARGGDERRSGRSAV